MGRCAAVQRDADGAHAHPQAGRDRRVRAEGPSIRHRRVPRSHPWPAPQTRPVLLSARRHPVQDAPPDVAGELRGRSRLPRPVVPRRQPGRSTPTRRGGRQDRQHGAGSQQAAVGDVLHRGPGQWSDRGAGQDPPRARRRCRFGQSVGPRDGPADRLTPTAIPMPANPRRPRANSCGRQWPTTCDRSGGCRG